MERAAQGICDDLVAARLRPRDRRVEQIWAYIFTLRQLGNGPVLDLNCRPDYRGRDVPAGGNAGFQEIRNERFDDGGWHDDDPSGS